MIDIYCDPFLSVLLDDVLLDWIERHDILDGTQIVALQEDVKGRSGTEESWHVGVIQDIWDIFSPERVIAK